MRAKSTKKNDPSNNDIVKKEMAEPRITKSAKIAQRKLGAAKIRFAADSIFSRGAKRLRNAKQKRLARIQIRSDSRKPSK